MSIDRDTKNELIFEDGTTYSLSENEMNVLKQALFDFDPRNTAEEVEREYLMDLFWEMQQDQSRRAVAKEGNADER